MGASLAGLESDNLVYFVVILAFCGSPFDRLNPESRIISFKYEKLYNKF